MSSVPINLAIVHHQAHGQPQRRLELTCHLSHSAPHPFCLLDAWLRIEGPNALAIAEGPLLYTRNAKIRAAMLWPNDTNLATLVIPFSNAVLQHLEDLRGGGDLALTIWSQLRISQGVKNALGSVDMLGVPFESHLQSTKHGDHIEFKLPQSEWVKILRGLQWSELDLIELPMTTSTSSNFIRALKRLQEGVEAYRRGQWEPSMSNCRKAFEALIKDTSGKDSLSETEATLSALISDAQKAKAINGLVRSLSSFLHLARHEHAESIDIGPKDALLALHVTAATLSYLAK